MDLALNIKNDSNLSDLEVVPPGLLTGQNLQTAVIISIFTDRRANPDDDVGLNESRRGWWADSYNPKRNDKIGSRLWLLKRAKLIDQTLIRAQEYVQEALAWLTEDNVASRVDVVTEFLPGTYGIAIGVTIVKPSGSETFNFEYAWNDING